MHIISIKYKLFFLLVKANNKAEDILLMIYDASHASQFPSSLV